MRLYINTADSKQVRVALKHGERVVSELSDDNQFGSQVLLPLINQLLEDQKISWSDLEAVEVETGPGSYTGLRVGAAVANAVGLGVGILVNGKPYETQIRYQ